jgi:short-subunit dehydrogenase
MKLDNTHVLITGAASGIGQAMALALAAKGCTLELVDQNAQGLQATQALLASYPVRVYTHTVDLAEETQIQQLWQGLAQAGHRVQVLINNAGVALMGRFDEVAAHDFDWLMRINFHAVVSMTRHYLQQHDLQSPGHIVNLSSLFGLIAPPEQTAYAASKFAMRGFSQSLSHELADTAVRITVAHPGGIATSIAQNARVGAGVQAQEAQRRLALAQRVLRMPPERAAHTILQAVHHQRSRVVVGLDAKLLSLIERIAPVAHGRLLRAIHRYFG